jgi:hypothetical protein
MGGYFLFMDWERYFERLWIKRFWKKVNKERANTKAHPANWKMLGLEMLHKEWIRLIQKTRGAQILLENKVRVYT